jgi:aminopeptidase N
MQQVIKRTEYTPLAFIIESIKLTIDLKPDTARIISHLHIKRNTAVAPMPLALNGEHLTLEQVVLDGRILSASEYGLTPTQLILADLPQAFELVITTIIYPDKNTELEGLYISNNIFCTQCEAHGFRRITYFPDRPDVMSTFTTTLIADKQQYPYLLSNGNPIDSGNMDGGRHFVTWHDPFKKPCYLFAVVAGNLDCLEDHFTTQSGRRITLRIFCEKGQRQRCHFAMHSLKQAMRWDEVEYGREYDLDIMMIVAVSDFNMGAMENKGLNIFNAKYILADAETATDADFEGIQVVVGHEYFHNWTGNRITCRDWFQLSLKEGLTVFRDQEFNADLTSRAIARIDDVNLLRLTQFPEDDGPLAHPVRPDSYIEVNNFYTATVYNKGAEVIRMLQTLLTPAGFRRGMDLYFERHDGQAVTCDDFVNALADANNIDVSQFKLWYSQAGTPRVDVAAHYDAKTQQYQLTLTQACPATPGQPDKAAMHIPIHIALLDKHGQHLPLIMQGKAMGQATVLNFTEPQQQFVFENIAQAPVPSLLRNFSAPVKLHFKQNQDALYTLFRHDNDAFNRWEAGQNLAFHLIDELMAAYTEGQYHLDERYPQTLINILQSDIDPALAARMLMLPTPQQIADRYNPIPVEAIVAAYQTLRETLAIRLYDTCLTLYQQLAKPVAYSFTAADVGRRSLKNTCLYYLVHSYNLEAVNLAVMQYRQANNMTDKLAALSVLANCENAERNLLLNDFYQHWQHDALVVDKWLQVQSTSELPDTLDNIKLLLEHPTFTYTNPNKVRALIGAFANNNFAHFHAMDGSGYAFLANQIRIIDKINPQIAARLVTPLTRWHTQQPLRQELMQDALHFILKEKSLSNNVMELVTKSLEPIT